MKKFYILLIAFMALNDARAQFYASCLPEGITFTTQTQIDSFQVNYPGCTGIEGDVTIQGGGITNLNGLSVIASIGGDLTLDGNIALTSLTGLEGLTSIVGDFKITGNDALSSCESTWLCAYLSNPTGSISIYDNAPGCNSVIELANACGNSMPCLPYGNYYFGSQGDIDNFQLAFPDCTELEGDVNIMSLSGSPISNLNGLSALTSIGGDLEISGNDSLTSLTGLDNLTSIGGGLDIYYNYSLISLTGLEDLTAIGGGLTVHWSWLTSLNGLDNLASIGGGIEIIYTTLTSLTGLEGLTSIRGSLTIGDYEYGSPYLTSLTGLENIAAGSITDLTIVDNPLLSTCDVKSICEYLASPNGTVIIDDNATGCNSYNQVWSACWWGLEESAVSGQRSVVNVYPNPTGGKIDFRFTVDDLGSVILGIFNAQGQEVAAVLDEKLSAGEHTVRWDAERMPAGIYFYRLAVGGQRRSEAESASGGSAVNGKIVKY